MAGISVAAVAALPLVSVPVSPSLLSAAMAPPYLAGRDGFPGLIELRPAQPPRRRPAGRLDRALGTVMRVQVAPPSPCCRRAASNTVAVAAHPNALPRPPARCVARAVAHAGDSRLAEDTTPWRPEAGPAARTAWPSGRTGPLRPRRSHNHDPARVFPKPDSTLSSPANSSTERPRRRPSAQRYGQLRPIRFGGVQVS
jgi:hypothetical protein